MKVLTIKQPWATLIAAKLKEYEFRSWKTNYRGLLLIHAGMGSEHNNVLRFKELNLNYPFSEILCLVRLTDCIKVDTSFRQERLKENELVYKTMPTDGYAFKLELVKLVNIKDVKGKLGLWNYTGENYE